MSDQITEYMEEAREIIPKHSKEDAANSESAKEGDAVPSRSNALRLLSVLEECGTRGALIDAYGPKASPQVSNFISGVIDARQDSLLSDIPSD